MLAYATLTLHLAVVLSHFPALNAGPRAQVLAASDPGMEAVWLESCRGSFAAMIADKQRREAAEAQSQAARSIAQPDELIDFVHLKVRAHMAGWG